MGEEADRLSEARAKVAEAAESPVVLDARAAVLEATEDPAERDRLLRPLVPVPAPQADGTWTWDWSAADTDREIPTGVLMHDDAPILPVGEVGILAGLGGAGKSRLALQIAVSAAGATDGEAAPVLHPHTVSAGRPGVSAALQVRGGPVVMAGYEDAPAWLRMRALEVAHWLDGGRDGGQCRQAVDNRNRRDRLSVAVAEPPLFAPAAPGEPATPTPAWAGLWERVREVGAGMVVVDPVALAWDAGVEGYPAGPVGAFVAALRREAVQASCGVLLVHHLTKATRSARREGRRLDAADVSGSHAWVDRVRGVLVLQAPGYRRVQNDRAMVGDAAAQEDYKWEPGWLGVSKANYSPSGEEVGWRVADVDARGIQGEHAERPVAWVEWDRNFKAGAGDGQTDEDRHAIQR